MSKATQSTKININFRGFLMVVPPSGWKKRPLRHAVILSWWLACSIFIIPLKFTETTLREKKRWVRVKRSEVAKVHYLCQRRLVKPFMLLVQYIQLLGCFHFFKTAAVCSGDIEITL